MTEGAIRGTPRATYRVQICDTFDLKAVDGVVEYLRRLGVTHLYTSPLLGAAPGSSHGYDVVDHSAVDERLGGEAGRGQLVRTLRAAGMGMVVDIVPNHMGVMPPRANAAWWDVLTHGRESRYADWFDVDWACGRVCLPVLDDDPAALEELRLVESDGETVLDYRGIVFPVAPGTLTDDARETHDRQHYELVSPWRATNELNYRRFFAISDLAAIRVENPDVLTETHREILRWYDAGELDGIRVDHPDGLAHPGEYLRQLRVQAPRAWIVVEKILEPGERLPHWPVEGTTGYDALREVDGLLIDPAGEAPLTRVYEELCGPPGTLPTSWVDTAYAAKWETATAMLRAEINRLAALAPDVGGVVEALAELLAAFPVYRSYLPEGAEHLRRAARTASGRRADLKPAIDELMPRLSDPDDELAVRFQQLTGAVMAKGVEDAALYRYTRFVALNEVGGSPAVFGRSVEDFHTACARRQAEWPRGMTTLSTHDTKRGEDVRARLAVLSEIPDAWAEKIGHWMAVAPVPGAHFGHLFWQTVVGTWPIERERLHVYFEKAAREANLDTSWAAPNEYHESTIHTVVERLYEDPSLRTEIDAFTHALRAPGWSNSLTQKLVQLTMPGVPDVYQGTEVWDNSLVDPDNRRPVDFEARAALLARLDDAGAPPPIDSSGAAKLWVVTRALRLRRDSPELFTGYTPVPTGGAAAAHVVAFDRGGAVTVGTRLPVRLATDGGWRDTRVTLPPGEWTNVLSGRSVSGGDVEVAGLLGDYPVALLGRGRGR